MKTLILTDIQYDFLPGGALAVERGDEVIPIANAIQEAFPLVIATQDWHPPEHASFARNHPGRRPYDVIEVAGLRQVLWPPHCVQGSRGAELAEGLSKHRIGKIVRKGADPSIDSYSAFYDNGHWKATDMHAFLKEQGAGPLYVMGLATDYCVKHTVLDACAAGFETFVIEDGCRGVELIPGDCERALAEMEAAGAKRVHSGSLLTAVA
jgi:nicotinamidase/pyrazinamidase